MYPFQTESEGQLRRRLTEAQAEAARRRERANEERVELQDWTALGVPVEDGGVTRTVPVYIRHEDPGDPTSIVFREPLPPEVAEQYEVRVAPCPILARRGDNALWAKIERRDRRDLELKELVLAYGRVCRAEGFADARRHHDEAAKSRREADELFDKIVRLTDDDD